MTSSEGTKKDNCSPRAKSLARFLLFTFFTFLCCVQIQSGSPTIQKDTISSSQKGHWNTEVWGVKANSSRANNEAKDTSLVFSNLVFARLLCSNIYIFLCVWNSQKALWFLWKCGTKDGSHIMLTAEVWFDWNVWFCNSSALTKSIKWQKWAGMLKPY